MLFVFVDAWSMMEQPLLFLKDVKLKTLPILYDKSIGLSTIITLPAAVFFMIPALLFYINFNEELEHGLTMGTYSMKG
jgi:multiple sugar transport system permease protein